MRAAILTAVLAAANLVVGFVWDAYPWWVQNPISLALIWVAARSIFKTIYGRKSDGRDRMPVRP